mgnify:CR=1 FL=1
MADTFKNTTTIIANQNQDYSVYTVPTADDSTVPPQKPVQALVKSILCTPVSTSVVSVKLYDASANQTVNILKDITMTVGNAGLAGYHDEEVLRQPLVMEDSDILKVQSNQNNALHVTVSVLEIKQ